MTSSTDLVLASTSKLPVEAVTSTIAILGKKGSGKTYTAKKLAELMLSAGYQVVILDTVGAWWGLKSSADGKSPGFALPILGGDHGDLKLDPAAGEVTARAIIEGGFSCIVDVRLMSKAGRHVFAGPFLETIYQVNRHALHLFVDEADFYAPQKTFSPQAARTLGAMDELVRRGRQGGTGITMITQRPQVLNKDVLTSTDILLTLRLNHHLDIKAVMEWVNVKADPAIAKQMLEDLPGMATGDFYMWAPELGLFHKSHADPAKTFDSSATPKPGKARVVPKVLADIDIAKLGERIQATVEEQKTNDPTLLKRRIAELERDAKKPAPVAADSGHAEFLQRRCADLETQVSVMRQYAADVITEARGAVESLRVQLNSIAEQSSQAIDRLDALGKRRPRELVQAKTVPMPTALPPPAGMKASQVAISTNGKLSHRVLEGYAVDGKRLPKAETALLRTMGQHGSMSRIALAFWSGYSPTSSSYSNAYGALRTLGMVTEEFPMELTEQGRALVGRVPPPPEKEEMFEVVCAKLPKAESTLLRTLFNKGGGPLSREALAIASGYSETSSSYSNAYGALRTLGFLTEGWPIEFTDDFSNAVF